MIFIKSSSILGILGIIFGMLGALVTLTLSAFSYGLITNALIAIFSSLLGIVSIWLSSQDNKIAAVEYLIAGVGLLLGISFFGILGFLFFIVAAILEFNDKKITNPVKEVMK